VDNATPGRTPFDWLRDPAERRGALYQIEQALARGWLDPARDDLEPLKATLTEALDDPATTAGQRRRMQGILTRLGAAAGEPAAVQ
jgi:hypothetical protein